VTDLPALDIPVNSKEGIELLFKWARAHGFVLNKAHSDIAKRYGVSTEGVMIIGPITR
jgi:hypothetical protein